MMRSLVIPLAMLACSDPKPTATPRHTMAPRRAEPAALAKPPNGAVTCDGDLRPHREVLVRGQPTAIARGGLRATYRGQSHDSYADGTTAVLLSLEVLGQPWLPDARDRTFHAFGSHCIRIAHSDPDRVELDVALQPAEEYAPSRCHESCCVTPAQRTPAPDGTVECCFCSDEPDARR